MREPEAPTKPRRQARSRFGAGATGLLVAVMVVALVVACVLSVFFGSRSVTFGQVIQAFSMPSGAAGDAGQDAGITGEVVRLRVPRTVLGMLVGAALAVSGALMQGVMRNPLADPSILGLNSGAAFAVVCAIATVGLSTPAQYMIVALVGGAAAAALVWVLGSLGRTGATPLKFTLAGAVLGSALGSLTSAIMLPRADVISTYRFWQVGGISGARFDLMAPVVPMLLIGFAIAAVSARQLDMLALGDQMAAGLGVNVTRARALAWAGAVLLSAGSTALAGPIGFVGLVVPHAARIIVGSDYRRIIALCMLIGPLLLVSSDVIGRVVSRPADVEVGIVTALIGAPVFVALVRAGKTAEV
ncbi:iron ABC transporter permease [Bifidobacterium sp. 82T10]|uniref:Iron ABC transporter permease n=2 Tax=Bifidobacterium miconis TaxID=2834435 RepID=A0ABS6WBZ0_9BIFI|nr:iron ABC transporter permease [Bifidobacterium miconis]MBW3091548.1 iron ABC transporter permease [Bifidobacterium miconis]